VKFLFILLLGCRPGETLIYLEPPDEEAPEDISNFDSGEIEDTAG
jgi:hypothetical protein